MKKRPLDLHLPQPKKVNERKENKKKPLEDIKDEREAEMRLSSMILLS